MNPLEVLPESCLKDQSRRHVKFERQKWFACACCPPNIARIIASLGGYIHSFGSDFVYTHLFVGSEAKLLIAGREVLLTIKTDYPWNGRVDIGFTVEDGINGAAFTYGFRIPGWCASYTLMLNGAEAECAVKDGYAFIERAWHSGDCLTIIFDMPVRFVEANPHVRENAGKVALMRGPLVYCLEEADNGSELFRLRAGSPAPHELQVRHETGLLEGVTSISFKGRRLKDWDTDSLYRVRAEAAYEDIVLKWIPYYAWANRTCGELCVWVNK